MILHCVWWCGSATVENLCMPDTDTQTAEHNYDMDMIIDIQHDLLMEHNLRYSEIRRTRCNTYELALNDMLT